MSRVVPGIVRSGEFVEAPSFVQNIRRTKGSKRAGQLFEQRVHRRFLKEWRGQYVNGPWIRFEGPQCGTRHCQPDGLLFDPWAGRIVVVECKISHTYRAWDQINRLYMPVVQAMFPDWEVAGVEVFKFFNHGEPYQEKPVVVWDLGAVKGGGNNIMRFEE